MKSAPQICRETEAAALDYYAAVAPEVAGPFADEFNQIRFRLAYKEVANEMVTFYQLAKDYDASDMYKREWHMHLREILKIWARIESRGAKWPDAWRS